MARAIQLTVPLAATEDGNRLPLASRDEILEGMATLLLCALVEEERAEGASDDDRE
jgi:hypothetical protein